jgi:peroxiredoxin
MKDLHTLPDDLPIPVDDGACDHIELARAMHLPTFECESSVFIKRMTVIVKDGVIRKVFYPVFPLDRNVHEVIDWVERYRGP